MKPTSALGLSLGGCSIAYNIWSHNALVCFVGALLQSEGEGSALLTLVCVCACVLGEAPPPKYTHTIPPASF